MDSLEYFLSPRIPSVFKINSFFFLQIVSALIPLAKQCAFEEPVTETISGENVLTWPFMVIL